VHRCQHNAQSHKSPWCIESVFIRGWVHNVHTTCKKARAMDPPPPLRLVKTQQSVCGVFRALFLLIKASVLRPPQSRACPTQCNPRRRPISDTHSNRHAAMHAADLDGRPASVSRSSKISTKYCCPELRLLRLLRDPTQDASFYVDDIECIIPLLKDGAMHHTKSRLYSGGGDRGLHDLKRPRRLRRLFANEMDTYGHGQTFRALP
jgi:hypothetical protein